MKKPVFTYPDHPPSWLDRWPDKVAIDRMFPLRLRVTANRIGSREAIRRLHWSDNTLELDIGSQTPVWRWRDKQWRLSCTCGYPGGACVHNYLADFFLRTVCHCEGWPLPGAASETASRPGSAEGLVQAAPAEPARPPQRKPASPPRQDSPTLFSNVSNQPAPARSPSDPRLEIEVDFHVHPGRVALRFYQTQNEKRRLLRLQELYNLSLQARSYAYHSQWSQQDTAFLEWFREQYKPRPRYQYSYYAYPYRPPVREIREDDFPELELAIKQNLRLLKMFESRFKKWQKHWRDTPGRFIERESQQPLHPEATQCRLHFEIFPEDDMVRIAAIVSLVGGGRYQYHEIFKLLSEGRRQVIVDGRMLDFKPPVAWRILNEFFSRKAPGIPRQHVLQYLPTIIENRFDLLHGDLIERRIESSHSPRLQVSAEGGDLLLQASIGQAAIHPEGVPADKLRESPGGQLRIAIYQSQDLPKVQEMMAGLSLVRTEKTGAYRLPGKPESAARFLALWQNLPATVEKEYSNELAPLLDPGIALRPCLKLKRGPVYIDLHLTWKLGSLPVQDSDLRRAASAEPPVVRAASGHWLTIDPQAFTETRRILGAAGFGQQERLRLFWPDARYLLLDLEKRGLEYEVPSENQAVWEELVNCPEPEQLPLPKPLQPVMRKYQKQGFAFLADRLRYRIGAILADDMGLGKTLQVLALIQALRQELDGQSDPSQRPPQTAGGASDRKALALVVCPASVSSVWQEECAKFCPDLKCAIYAGSPEQRRLLLKERGWDLLIANYALVRNDIDVIAQTRFELAVLDEAQQIKNPEALVSQAVKRLQTEQRLALTGTPLENRLLDLWSIMDFLNPDFLDSQNNFIKTYESTDRAAELGRFVAPIMLRRTKSMVAAELPPRISEVIRIEMGEQQRQFYDRLLAASREKAGKSNTAIEILALLTRLRQACCDPRLIQEPSHRTEDSAKLETLLGMVEELLAEDHSILIFSQFVGMLNLIEEALRQRDLNYAKITGQTPVQKRGEIVREFNQNEKPGVFLLSLKAAGTGLTLTRADYVFIYDPWWNPAVENQAIDRTHRIGQTKTVVAYRLVTAATVEENVMRLQKEKAELFDAVVGDSQSADYSPMAKLSTDQLRQLLD